MSISVFHAELPAKLQINKQYSEPYLRYEGKIGIHPAGDGVRPLMGGEAVRFRNNLLAQPGKGASSVYLHVPYCESKCTYCGFFGGQYSEEKGSVYVDALLKEMEMDAPFRQNGRDELINAVYFGGGTPTALSAAQLKRLLKAVRSHFKLANDVEITIEGRNHKFTRDKLEACFEEGVNRFSLGVQTFDTEIRHKLGRISPRQEVLESLKMMQEYNQAAVIIDLIYGLPGQNLSHWLDDIRTVYDLGLDGVDLYQLNILPGTTLEGQLADGKVTVAAIAERYKMYEEALALTENLGFKSLSVSHWGLSGRERNIYNGMMKSRKNAFSYGAGAGGTLFGSFYANSRDPHEYLAKMERNEKPLGMIIPSDASSAVQSQVLAQLEHLILDTNQISPQLRSSEPLKNAVNYLEHGALIEETHPGIYQMTPVGRFWHTNVVRTFTHAIGQAMK